MKNARIASLVVVFALVACIPAADAPIPRGYDQVVSSARASLIDNSEQLVPPTFSFAMVRCFANGGLVVVFRRGGGNGGGDVAFAMQGRGAVADAWAGGFGQQAMDQEVAFNFGGIAEVTCPPR